MSRTLKGESVTNNGNHDADKRLLRPEWQAHLIGAAVLTLAGLIWLLITAPMPVVRGTTAIDSDVPLSYMITAFPFLGILLADIAVLLAAAKTRRRGLALLIQTGLVCVLSALRLAVHLPLSGHLLLLAFFLLYGFSAECAARDRLRSVEVALCAVVFLALLAVKLLIWTDWLTPLVAVVAAALIWLPGSRYHRETANQLSL